MVKKGDVLSNDFLVCVKIFEFNEKRERIWFRKLVQSLEGSLSQTTVSRCIDRLFDRGMIDAEWEMVDGKWIRTLRITEEFEGFVRSLYNVTEECDEQRGRSAGSR